MSDTFLLAPDARAPVAPMLKHNSAANTGLIWERYLPVWTGTQADPRRAKLYAEPLREFAKTRTAANGPGTRLLHEHAERQRRALQALAENRGMTCLIPAFRVVWRFAIGLGSAHPVGNGFTFDGPTGAPYLPGASVKGLCRRAAALDGLTETETEQLFGPGTITAARPAARGGLTFFDALPEEWPRLGVDIINSHHSAYYAELHRRRPLGAQDDPLSPRETEDPNPVYFLTVESGACFGFPILAGSDAEAKTAIRLLTRGLDWLGAGAKTAVGYGVFCPVDAATGASRPARDAGAREQQTIDARPVPPLRRESSPPPSAPARRFVLLDGERVELLDQQGDMVRVRLADGSIDFVGADEVQPL